MASEVLSWLRKKGEMGMTDREKVIKGLECCAECGKCKSECPYDGKNNSMYGCTTRLAKDALELLKAQEPRLITEEDFEDKTRVDDACGLPVWVEYRRDDEWGEYWEDTSDEWGIIYKQFYRTEKSMRYWTSRPTDEQRENTPWDNT